MVNKDLITNVKSIKISKKKNIFNQWKKSAQRKYIFREIFIDICMVQHYYQQIIISLFITLFFL